jgi:UDP-N-acetylglucosamine 2-epimerase (non-hydrolysing)
MKILTLLGTRPEAIKLAPVIREIQRQSPANKLTSLICVTSQHREMADQVLKVFGIVPDYDFNIMRDDQTPTQVATAVLSKLDSVLLKERPDWMLVQGDTTTVVASALAAFYAKVKVGHVEAGLRTYNKLLPFPEEINRRLAGVIADLHFAPTERARQNLLREGIPTNHILLTGNTVIDALQIVADLPYDPTVGPLNSVPWDKRLILVTAHRRENLGKPLEQICLAIRDIVSAYPKDVHVVYPVHRNPNVHKTVHRLLADISGVTLTNPLEYLPLVYLMKHSYLVLTDSGGIQEEAPGFGKPVLVMRQVTERPEAVEAGTAIVVGTNRERIVTEARRLLESREKYEQMARAVNPYGDGHAAKRIVKALLEFTDSKDT